MKKGYVYILSNYTRTTFHIGVTSNLVARIEAHKSGETKGFAQRYDVKYLLYYEEFDSIIEAIRREKQLKNWHRDWKINLIKSVNPELKEISELY